MAREELPPGLEALASHFGLKIDGAEDADAVKEEELGLNGTVQIANGEKAAEAKESNGEATSDQRQVEPGSQSTYTEIYQGEPDSIGRMTWTSKMPEDWSEPPAENENTLSHAIVIRNGKSEDSRKRTKVHSLVVQSPHLKKALSEIFRGYPGVFCGLSRLVFTAPFKPFVHRWGKLLEYVERTDHTETMAAHLKLLHEVLRRELSDSIRAFEDYIKHGVITFDNVWMIFQPGATILAPNPLGEVSALEFLSGYYNEDSCGKNYQLQCNSVDWDGESFGWDTTCQTVPEFLGTCPIKCLRIYPLSFHPTKELIKAKLVKRGKKFESLAGLHYRRYTGTAIQPDENGKEKPVHVTGRIVVDTASWGTHSGLNSVYVTPIPKKANEKEDLSKEESSNNEKVGSTEVKTQVDILNNRQRLLCVSFVRGYSLKLKKWLKFAVDDIKDIEFNKNVFKKLVLPNEEKELILALSQSQVAGLNSFDDHIQGKGKGVILLLTGPPGVGKTLTAEAVSESMRVPLFMMSAGDLGINPEDVEQNLQDILELVAKWRAILLIDECDVFLEARSAHDLERNKLVSIFLRLLEYYEGILFLTTNRVGNMDQAFHSRIHLTMRYPDLTEDSRRQIWRTFVGELNYPNRVKDAEIAELARIGVNGRQIKNVIKTAQLVAVSRKEQLSKEHIDIVLAVDRGRD